MLCGVCCSVACVFATMIVVMSVSKNMFNWSHIFFNWQPSVWRTALVLSNSVLMWVVLCIPDSERSRDRFRNSLGRDLKLAAYLAITDGRRADWHFRGAKWASDHTDWPHNIVDAIVIDAQYLSDWPIWVGPSNLVWYRPCRLLLLVKYIRRSNCVQLRWDDLLLGNPDKDR